MVAQPVASRVTRTAPISSVNRMRTGVVSARWAPSAMAATLRRAPVTGGRALTAGRVPVARGPAPVTSRAPLAGARALTAGRVPVARDAAFSAGRAPVTDGPALTAGRVPVARGAARTAGRAPVARGKVLVAGRAPVATGRGGRWAGLAAGHTGRAESGHGDAGPAGEVLGDGHHLRLVGAEGQRRGGRGRARRAPTRSTARRAEPATERQAPRQRGSRLRAANNACGRRP